jgi:prefoldin subunit 5
MSEQSPIFNQQHATIGVNYAAEGSKQQFTQNINTTEQNFEVLLTNFKQFIHNLQQEYPDVVNETEAYQIIDVKVKEQPLHWQNFLQLQRLWNGG